ncbi:9491_t:CDS:1, partial [Acaulospora colombiana]
MYTASCSEGVGRSVLESRKQETSPSTILLCLEAAGPREWTLGKPSRRKREMEEG